MEAIGFYLLKSSVVSGVFILIYHLTLRNESFYRLSRFYLLASLLFAYAFPFIKISLEKDTTYAIPIIENLQTTFNQFAYVEETPITNITAHVNTYSYEYWWILIPITISVLFLFRLIKNLFQLIKTITAYEKITRQAFTLVLFNHTHTFSFFRYIFISQEVWHSPNGNSIINHELSHLKHKHSMDRLFMEILLVAFWMNPFIYLYRKALEEVHEFQADKDVTQNTSTKDYFNLVLQQSSAHNYSPLMSPFSYKLIKKRIKMANYKSNPIKRLLMVLPFAVALLIIFASATISQTNTITSNHENYAWPSDDRKYNCVIVDMHKTPDANALTTMTEEHLSEHSNVLPILINSQGDMLIGREVGDLEHVKSRVKTFMEFTTQTGSNAPVIFLKKDVNTSYDIANAVLTKVNLAIDELRNQSAKEKYNKPFSQCNIEQKIEFEEAYPRQIIIAPSKAIYNKNKPAISFSSPIRKEELTKISSGYGIRKHPITKEKKQHNGVDYVAPLKTEVLTIGDGTVRKVNHAFEEGKGHGRFVIVDHNNGYSSLYSQLNAYKVKEGQKIKAGDVVGLLGSSGRSTGPHLHLEIKKDGQFIDPESVIKK